MSLIKKLGFYESNDGFTHRVVCVDAPGDYPVVAIQLKRDGSGIAKDGLRAYTQGGRVYANGSTDHGSNLDPDTFRATEAKEVRMVLKYNGSTLAGPRTVHRGTDEHEFLEDSGWEESPSA